MVETKQRYNPNTCAEVIMVENTILQATPIVKNTDDIRFLSIGSLPAVLSTEVAKNFQKKHSDVLREIDRLRSILPKTFEVIS